MEGLDRESWETRLYRAFSAAPRLGFYSELGGKPFEDFEEQRDATYVMSPQISHELEEMN